jgi:hypothetical protein
MANHVIIQVRDALIAKLKAGVPGVSNRVYKFGEVQFEEVDENNSPFILVQLADDSAEIMAVNSVGGGALAILEDLKPTIFVHCIVKMSGDAEAAAYNVRGDVEATLLATTAGRTLDGKVTDIVRVAAGNNRDEASDLGVYSSALQLEVQIRHIDGQPTSFSY